MCSRLDSSNAYRSSRILDKQSFEKSLMQSCAGCSKVTAQWVYLPKSSSRFNLKNRYVLCKSWAQTSSQVYLIGTSCKGCRLKMAFDMPCKRRNAQVHISQQRARTQFIICYGYSVQQAETAHRDVICEQTAISHSKNSYRCHFWGSHQSFSPANGGLKS